MMNVVTLIGRLTKDVELKGDATKVARLTLAVDKDVKPTAEGAPTADFPSVVVFGKTAEFLAAHAGKGAMISVVGHITTGSYKKEDGTTVYTTDVIGDRIRVLSGYKGDAAGNEAPIEVSAAADDLVDDEPNF